MIDKTIDGVNIISPPENILLVKTWMIIKE